MGALWGWPQRLRRESLVNNVGEYASRSLTDPEKRYSQIGLEALAGDFGSKKFNLFLYGRPQAS